LALTDRGAAAYSAGMAARLAALGAPVCACTPGLFTELMAASLGRDDLHGWVAAADIELVRGRGEGKGRRTAWTLGKCRHLLRPMLRTAERWRE